MKNYDENNGALSLSLNSELYKSKLKIKIKEIIVQKIKWCSQEAANITQWS